MELRTFFQENPEYDISSLYNEEYLDYYLYKWKPKEYYKNKNGDKVPKN